MQEDWANLIQQYLTQRKPELLDAAMLAAAADPEVIAFLQAYQQQDLEELTNRIQGLAYDLRSNKRRYEVFAVIALWIVSTSRALKTEGIYDHQVKIINSQFGWIEAYLKEIEAYLKEQLGREKVQEGAWYQGLDLLRESLATYRSIEDPQGKASASLAIGEAHQKLEDYEVALSAYMDAERFARQCGDTDQQALAKMLRGSVEIQLLDLESAIPHLQEASRYFHEQGDEKRAALCDQLLTLAPTIEFAPA